MTYPNNSFEVGNFIERILVIGILRAPKKVLLSTKGMPPRELRAEYDNTKKFLTIRKPDVIVTTDFEITFD